MPPEHYRIESTHPITHRLLRTTDLRRTFTNASVAVAFAAKCVSRARGDEVRVVHVPTGNIIFRTPGYQACLAEDL